MIRVSQQTGVLLLLGAACASEGTVTGQTTTLSRIEHVTFDSPEGWALKYFTSATTLSGLQPPSPQVESARLGSVTLGLESDWLPALDAARERVGFNGHKQEELNKAPVIVRPIVRVGLPWKFVGVVAAPPPIHIFGVTPRVIAFGVERSIVARKQWTLGWRLSGQFGSVKAAFTCPASVLGFPPKSSENPSGCVGTSSDSAGVRYGGTELQGTYRIPRLRRLTTHATLGFDYINTSFQVNAPVTSGLDRTRLWTAGNLVAGTAGVSYLLTSRIGLTVDAFYSPLFVRRVAGGPRTNDGLFNVRALVSYTLR